MANITGTSGDDKLIGTAYIDVINGLAGADTMTGGAGGDIYYVDNAGDSVIEKANGGVDTIRSSINLSLAAGFDNVEKLVLLDGALEARGNILNNTLIGNAGENFLRGDSGNDTLIGGKGNDTYLVESLGDKIVEKAGEGTDVVIALDSYSLAPFAYVEELVLKSGTAGTGNALNNTIIGNGLENIINGGAGADTMSGGAGNDTYYFDNIGDTIKESMGSGIHDAVVSTVALSNAIAEVEDYDFSKFAGGVAFTASSADNIIKGGAGVDTLIGLTGNDTYYVNSVKDKIVEEAFSGSDTVATGSFSIDLSKYANIEHAKLTGIAALNATGTAIGNILFGNDGANILNGMGGADTMFGGKGNDKYHVDNVGDQVTEAAGEGIDTVVSSIYYELGANVENLTLAAGAGAISGVGNDGKNLLIGNEGMNALAGGAGADTMKGGDGDDTYYVDNIGDKVIELANQGADIVVSTVDFSLAALGNVEMLDIDGDAIKATGNALNNLLIGNDKDNIIDGGLGADEMWGGKGNDTYFLNSFSDQIVENSGQGIDTIVSTKALTTVISNVENYDFRQLSVGVNFTGDDAENKIWGGSGIDTLAGGANDDTYVVNSVKDIVIEKVGEGGDDTIVTSVFSIDLSKYATVEHATLTGTTALNLKGTAGVANVLTGNAGANVIDGLGGADTLIGGKGNDKYIVHNANDVVIENAGEGIDTVLTSVNYTLAASVENLTLGAGANMGTGNALNNLIVGNDLLNVLRGEDGADTMKGGKGDDFYYVDNAGDKVVELAGEGHDTVRASIDYTLVANVEDLILDAGAFKGTGNALANLIVGNADSNVINGGAGADTMKGGDGWDKYYIDNLNDLVVENASEGWDTVYSTVALTHGFANVEDYDFSKAKSAVNFTGTDDNNRIFASTFNDTLAGGKGDDTYYLNNVGDKVVELSGEGKDTVISSVSVTVTKLADNVENVILKEGAGALSATGNDLDNHIGGNSSNNVLNGGIGNDTIDGGSGSDVLTGGAGADEFQFWGAGKGGSLSGHDVITDFDFNNDILAFRMAGDADGDGIYGEYEDFVAGIVDQGAGKDVVLHLISGASITFKGIGTGMIDHITDLVANPMTQIVSD